MISTLKVIIDFANHFRSAEYCADCQLNLRENIINDQTPQCI